MISHQYWSKRKSRPSRRGKARAYIEIYSILFIYLILTPAILTPSPSVCLCSTQNRTPSPPSLILPLPHPHPNPAYSPLSPFVADSLSFLIAAHSAFLAAHVFAFQGVPPSLSFPLLPRLPISVPRKQNRPQNTTISPCGQILLR